MLVDCGMPLTDAARREVEEFLCHETALLDGRRFEEWLSLFTADALD
jgi:3-phenylpropionate/cinnamic acid dioxygenase small subunit